MSNRLVSKVLIFTAVSAFLVFLSGCGAPGKSAQEIHRAHMRYLRTEMLMMQDDIDSFMMIDRPSRLSDRAVR